MFCFVSVVQVSDPFICIIGDLQVTCSKVFWELNEVQFPYAVDLNQRSGLAFTNFLKTVGYK